MTFCGMNNYNKNLLILFNTGWLDEKTIEFETESLATLLLSIETSECFCSAFELVNRNTITNKHTIILREAKYFRLRPFRFLINKN